VLLGAAACLAVVGGVWFAVASASGPTQPEVPDYIGYNLKRPWMWPKPWPWFNDMVDQQSLKPQEEGTLQNLPPYSVPRTGVEPFIPESAMVGGKSARDVMPKNPEPKTPESIANGKVVFETYCAACHARDGMGVTPVTQKGMPPIPLALMVPSLSEPHIYNKDLYGGPPTTLPRPASMRCNTAITTGRV
jgi:hypothetical protein